jgi:hypothetical protein
VYSEVVAARRKRDRAADVAETVGVPR